ncbi:TRAP transporter small permease [uncultured Castellaniella sp.]|uniref:TRAP transporter small permease n=1 Tax=uncultured Castellaniella sp. TaxID=647907 RepID=UPI00261836C5|nr:TRAP transporter small permease [uncultured Castellaniella sp.]
MSKFLVSLIDRLNFIVRILIGLGLLCMVVLISLQVAVRFILPKLGMPAGLPWTEEAARYLMVWVIFLGGAIAARHGLLIAVTALIEALPSAPSRLLRRAALALLAGIFVAMAWYGWQWTQFGADEISPALTLSKFWLYLAMPVGCTLAAVNTLVLMLRNGEAHEALAA